MTLAKAVIEEDERLLMSEDDIPSGLRCEYNEVCECGMGFTVFTQGGQGKYQTEIFIKCGICDGVVRFKIPVN